MRTPKERLSHLLELAAKGQEQRATLAGEVAELLHDWPATYPLAMRTSFEALLEKIAREVDAAGRRELARRFEGRSDASLVLLNELFFAASAAMKDQILARNDAHAVSGVATIDGAALLAAARSHSDFSAALASTAAIPRLIAADIMADTSCRSLAVVMKGAGLQRPIYSGICVLALPSPDIFAALSVYDRVPTNGAAGLLAFWRAKCGVFLEGRDAA
jgi:hypothetical protein